MIDVKTIDMFIYLLEMLIPLVAITHDLLGTYRGYFVFIGVINNLH